MSKLKIKPCVKHQEQGEFQIQQTFSKFDGCPIYRVRCCKCGMSSRSRKTFNGSILAWNEKMDNMVVKTN